MNEPYVSIILSAYRPRADWLKVAVRSALAQQGPEIELIVVDDGSPEPVKPLLSWVDDPRVRCMRVEHGGLAAGRNAGIDAARGRYVRFLDADDAFPPDSTQELLGLVGAREDLIAYGATVFCDEELRPRWTMRSRVSGDARRVCVCGAFNVRIPAMLFPRVLFERVRFDPSFGTTEDWDFFLRALEYARVVGTTKETLLYRRHSGGMTADRKASARDAERVISGYFERHPEQRGTRLERRARGYLDAQAVRVALAHGELRAVLARLPVALRSAPGALLREGLLAASAVLQMGSRRLRDRRAPAGDQADDRIACSSG